LRPGNSTEVLAARFAGADILGVDVLSDMIAAARARLPRWLFGMPTGIMMMAQCC